MSLSGTSSTCPGVPYRQALLTSPPVDGSPRGPASGTGRKDDAESRWTDGSQQEVCSRAESRSGMKNLERGVICVYAFSALVLSFLAI